MNIVLVPFDIEVILDWCDDDYDYISENLGRKLHYYQVKALVPLNQCSSTFLESLRVWGLNEFLCVRSYLIGRPTDSLNQFRDDVMEAFHEDTPYITETSEPYK